MEPESIIWIKISCWNRMMVGLALRIVGDTLPEEAVQVDDNMDLEDVYLYYFE